MCGNSAAEASRWCAKEEGVPFRLTWNAFGRRHALWSQGTLASAGLPAFTDQPYDVAIRLRTSRELTVQNGLGLSAARLEVARLSRVTGIQFHRLYDGQRFV
jgi:hypothetical protein